MLQTARKASLVSLNTTLNNCKKTLFILLNTIFDYQQHIDFFQEIEFEFRASKKVSTMSCHYVEEMRNKITPYALNKFTRQCALGLGNYEFHPSACLENKWHCDSSGGWLIKYKNKPIAEFFENHGDVMIDYGFDSIVHETYWYITPEFRCSCQYWEAHGIACRHLIFLCNMLGLKQIKGGATHPCYEIPLAEQQPSAAPVGLGPTSRGPRIPKRDPRYVIPVRYNVFFY